MRGDVLNTFVEASSLQEETVDELQHNLNSLKESALDFSELRLSKNRSLIASVWRTGWIQILLW